MPKNSVQRLTRGAIVAALYVLLTLLSSALGLGYGPVQLRLGEGLCVLPFLFPEAVWGLTVGCLIANILSPYGVLDAILGTLATFLAARLTGRCRSKWLAPMPAVVCSALLVGFALTVQQTGLSPAFGPAFALNAGSVALGQAAACYGLGLLVLRLLPRHLPA